MIPNNHNDIEAEWDDVPDMCIDFDAFAEAREKEKLAVTWTCHICGDERPDRFIDVHTRDVSADFNLPLGTVQENVRHCIDRDNCVQRVKHERLINKDTQL